jgi:hypothetical protein
VPLYFLKLGACALLIALTAASPLYATDTASPFNHQLGEAQIGNWNFREDFSKGIPGWMSFPLSQDVGYDPSIYTAQRSGRAALVRDVVAQQGEDHLRIGMLRPLSFHATAASVFRLEYSLETAGRLAGVKLSISSVSGKQYSAELPLKTGRQQAQISGRALGLASSGDDIETTLVEAIVEQPAWGSHNQLIIFAFDIEAQRTPAIALRSPRLTHSEGMQVSVADAVSESGKPLQIQMEDSNQTATLMLLDGAGKENSRSTFTGATTPNLSRESPGLWTAIIESDSGRTEFRFLLLGAKTPHPRVLLSAARLSQLKKDSLLRDLIHRKSQQLAAAIVFNSWAGENIEHLSPVSVLVGLPQYFTQMENYSNAASLGALDYVLNQNPEGLALAKRVLIETAAWPSWTPPWFSAHGLHTYYGTGIFSQRIALAYDLIADQLSPQEKSQVANGFLRNSIQPAIDEYFLNDRMPIAASNHMAHAIGGAIADCIALAGDVPKWEEQFAPKLAQLTVSYERLIKGLFPGDGSEAEPAGYEDFAMEGMSWGAAALDALEIHSTGLEKMLQAFWWERYIRIRADLMLDSGDFDGYLTALTGFAWSAEYTHDPSLRAFYESGNSRTLAAISRLHDTGRALESMPALLDLVCCTESLQESPEPPPSRVFPVRGSAVLRSGWTQDDTLISLRAGPWFNHEHHDQGSFQVAAFGEQLIAEAGYSDYYKDPRYLDYFTQATGHNTVMVDDNPFSQGDYDGRYWKAFRVRPAITRHLFSENIDYLAADLAPAYKGTLKQFTREYLFLKPGLLIIRDRLSSAGAHKYTWLLHAQPGTRIATNAEQATITGSKGSALISTSEGSWSVVPEPIPVIAYSDFERGRIFSRSAFELETPKEMNHTFLVGIRLVKLPTTDSPLNWKRESNGTGFDFRSVSGEVHGTFRTSQGKLSIGSTATDGDALFIGSSAAERDMFASQTRNFNEERGPGFSSTVPVDVVLHESGSTREFLIAGPGASKVSFSFSKPPSEFLLDKQPVSARYDNGRITVSLTEGEHVVSFQP